MTKNGSKILLVLIVTFLFVIPPVPIANAVTNQPVNEDPLPRTPSILPSQVVLEGKNAWSDMFGDPGAQNKDFPDSEPFTMPEGFVSLEPSASCHLEEPELLDAIGLFFRVDMIWSDVSGATGYRIYYDDEGTTEFLHDTVDDADPLITTYTDWINNNGLVYCYKITAYDGTCETDYSNIQCASPGNNPFPDPPTAFEKTSPPHEATGQPGNTILQWSVSADAVLYEYCYDTTDDDTCSGWSSNGSATSVSISGLTLNTTYYWHVRAIGIGATTYSNGASTAFWSFTTEGLPDPFNKTSPADGATYQLPDPTLSWDPSSAADSYEYCYDTSDDDACTTWISTGTSTSVSLSSLSEFSTYYWHVRAINTFGTTYANSDTYWSFTTGGSPDIFDKTSPADAATGLALDPTLEWGASTAANSYEYCYDTSNDDTCTTWISTGTSTSVALSSLSEYTTYYWHVRAINTFGTTYANSDVYWSFTTISLTPEMEVRGNGVVIVAGDTSPTLADHTDFGTAAITGGTITRTFTIHNLGNIDLNLTGTPKVEVGGINAAEFIVIVQPASPITPTGSTTFTVLFNPAAEGSRSATISISNDDSDKNPYDFSILGQGELFTIKSYYLPLIMR